MVSSICSFVIIGSSCLVVIESYTILLSTSFTFDILTPEQYFSSLHISDDEVEHLSDELYVLLKPLKVIGNIIAFIVNSLELRVEVPLPPP